METKIKRILTQCHYTNQFQHRNTHIFNYVHIFMYQAKNKERNKQKTKTAFKITQEHNMQQPRNKILRDFLHIIFVLTSDIDLY